MASLVDRLVKLADEFDELRHEFEAQDVDKGVSRQDLLDEYAALCKARIRLEEQNGMEVFEGYHATFTYKARHAVRHPDGSGRFISQEEHDNHVSVRHPALAVGRSGLWIHHGNVHAAIRAGMRPFKGGVAVEESQPRERTSIGVCP